MIRTKSARPQKPKQLRRKGPAPAAKPARSEGHRHVQSQHVSRECHIQVTRRGPGLGIPRASPRPTKTVT